MPPERGLIGSSETGYWDYRGIRHFVQRGMVPVFREERKALRRASPGHGRAAAAPVRSTAASGRLGRVCLAGSRKLTPAGHTVSLESARAYCDFGVGPA